MSPSSRSENAGGSDRSLGLMPEDPYDSTEYLSRPEPRYVDREPAAKPGERIYDAERAVLHDRIIEELLASARPPAGARTALFVAGGPLAGKRTLLRKLTPEKIPEAPAIVDPLIIRELIPEYPALAAARDFYSDVSVRDEVLDLTRRLFEEGKRRRLNLIVVGLGAGPPGRFAGHLRATHEDGYEVDLVVAAIEVEVALARQEDRARRTGRYVEDPVVLDRHREVLERLDEVAAVPHLTVTRYASEA
jgi:hypothetical protein